LAHQNLPDEEMRDIPNPWNEMQLHISYKFAQAGWTTRDPERADLEVGGTTDAWEGLLILNM
jgi:hypothetical protein